MVRNGLENSGAASVRRVVWRARRVPVRRASIVAVTSWRAVVDGEGNGAARRGEAGGRTRERVR